MKHITLLLTALTTIICSLPTNATDRISIEPQWLELDYNTEQFGSSWILVGNVTFKKRSKEPINMEQLTLTWKGPQVDDLLGSLYKKPIDKQFLPIEDNLVCDGCWSKTKQRLFFKFNKKQNLGFTNTFCIVLSIPPNLSKPMQKGHFEIEVSQLPMQFRTLLSQPLSLPLNHRSA